MELDEQELQESISKNARIGVTIILDVSSTETIKLKQVSGELVDKEILSSTEFPSALISRDEIQQIGTTYRNREKQSKVDLFQQMLNTVKEIRGICLDINFQNLKFSCKV